MLPYFFLIKVLTEALGNGYLLMDINKRQAAESLFWDQPTILILQFEEIANSTIHTWCFPDVAHK